MKEPDYILKIKATGGALILEGCTDVCHKWQDGNESHKKRFTYTKLFQWNFQYHHIFDNGVEGKR